MKKIKNVCAKLALMAPVGLMALWSCSEELNVVDGAVMGNTTISAGIEPRVDGDGSRTAIDPTDYTSGQIGINWIPEDKIGVFGTSTKNAEFANASTTETPSTEFKGDLASGENAVYAYYPYTATAGTNHKAVQGTLPLVQHYNTQSRTVEGDWKVGAPATDGDNTHFKFENVMALFRFEINASGTEIADENLEAIELTIDGLTQPLGGDFTLDLSTKTAKFTTPAAEANTLRMEWSDKPALGKGKFLGYMSVAPVASGLDGKTMTIKIISTYNIATFNVKIIPSALEGNSYYTLPLTLSEYKNNWTVEKRPDVEDEPATWVSGLNSKLACANTMYSLPDTPYMHKIRVASKYDDTFHTIDFRTDVQISVYGLPEGLYWNEKRNLVYGKVATPGDYTYSVIVKDSNGNEEFREGIKLHVGNDILAPTPMMGFQTWNVMANKVSYDDIVKQVDAMKAKDLPALGYKFFGVDDCWQATSGARESNGMPSINTTYYPNGIDKVADYITKAGLVPGIYSDCGTHTCANANSNYNNGGNYKFLGAYGYEQVHATTFTNWGFKMLKEDWFWSGNGDNNCALNSTDTQLAYDLYKKMGDCLVNAGNKIQLYMCEWGIHAPWRWAAETGATHWRVTYDHREGWWGKSYDYGKNSNDGNYNGGIGLHNTIGLMRYLWPYCGVNRYNDPDMICVGIGDTKETSAHPSSEMISGTVGFSDDENQTAFVMWCMWNAPILLGFDMTRTDINSTALALIKNEDLIKLDQDPMGQAAEYIKTVNGVDYYMKDLANGDVAIAAVNLSDYQRSYSISLGDYPALESGNTYTMRDLISKSESTLSASSAKSGTLAKHATVVFRLSKQ